MPLADHAEVVVVKHDDFDRQLVDLRGGEIEITVLSGQASCAPMAAGKPKPMVPAPPEESQWKDSWFL